MNVGKVYFSAEQRLNHAAINPAFSLMESLAKQKDFSKQYRFIEIRAHSIVKDICRPEAWPAFSRISGKTMPCAAAHLDNHKEFCGFTK